MTLHPAARRQIEAADPAGSTWLAANAGSGKTSVLTDRVARLLIGGTPPGRILCLTYTKAAAAEMQNRLFRRLGDWAMRPDAALAADLGRLGIDAGALPGGLAAARRLFARAVETPGGLKIQTIHAFCAAILRRFPLEAGVSPAFREADERACELLRAEIVEDMADHLAPDVVVAVAREAGGDGLAGLATEIATRRARFGTAPVTLAEILAGFGLPPDLTEAAIPAIAFVGGEATLLADVVPILRGQSSTMQKLAQTLAAIDPGRVGADEMKRLYDAFLYRSDGVTRGEAKTGSIPTANAGRALGPLLEPFHDFMRRVARAREAEIGLAAAPRSLALADFARVFLPEYARRKAARGWLDFDDLILGARDLLADPAVAQWVLFRLDGGVDHILIDEAQDTAPAQWAVIGKLAEEMLAGEGARERGRTVFVVGDKKQSIYSFQGADLRAFDGMRAHFAARMADAPAPLRTGSLHYSFRSASAVLGAVDATFATLDPALAEAALGADVRHLAFFEEKPGRVDLWPLRAAEDAEEDEDWTDPVDRPAPRHPALMLAADIAREIRRMIETGTQIPTREGVRPMHAGDVLILVQRRSLIFDAIIRACKAEGLPVAGADRLRLGGEMAVRDLAALLAFIATPADDLSLAVALRSPLFGWSEAALHELAAGRAQGAALWSALLAMAERAVPIAVATVDVLHDLRDRSDFLRPFELIERMLTRHGGRRRLLARLGLEAEEGVDELLSQALAYERSAVPNLTGFLVWLQADTVDVRRQPDVAGRRLRVMTVHGAKGLEAPVVFLPDTADRQNRDRSDICFVADDVPVWKPSANMRPQAVQAAIDAELRRQEEERLRLLYVAMTRAESWLIVAAAGKLDKGDAWHDLVAQGLGQLGAMPHDFPTGPGLRLVSGEWPADAGVASAAAQSPAEPARRALTDDWADLHVPAVRHRPAWVTPTSLGGAKLILGADEADDPAMIARNAEAAMARGTRIHLLLEHLPGVAVAARGDLAARLLADLPAEEARALVAEATAVLDDPGLAAIFAPAPGVEVFAEVALAAEMGDLPMIGIVDRLIVTPSEVIAVDYKTNRVVPEDAADIPEGILRQMAAYRAALGRILPGRKIATAVVWTARRLVQRPSDAQLDEALRRALADRAADLDVAEGDP